MKKIKFVIISIILTIFFSAFTLSIDKVYGASNNIKSISMDVFINQDGSASITEVWNATLSQGTEGYKPYGNLGNSKITNFSVSDDLNNTYTTLSSWNVKGSFESKKYKCGINKTGSKVELCWGISNYGNRTYTLKYTITNFVNQYTDSQGIYFSLMPKEMDQTPQSVKITLHSSKQFNEENSKIWAFGYKGNINFENGKIVMSTDGKLASSSYMTALVKINDGTFATTNKVSKNFDSVYNQAMEGVSQDEKNDNYTTVENTLAFVGKGLAKTIGSILIIFMNPMFIIMIIMMRILKEKKLTTNLYFGEEGTKLPKIEEVAYYRDIPFEKNLYRAYWICKYYSINFDYKQGLIGAILLKWIRDDKVNIIETKKGLFSLKDNNYAIDLNKITSGDNELENELLSILKRASKDNLILESKEFEKWCRNNYYIIDKWFAKVKQEETEKLKEEGLIVETEIEKNGIFGRTYKVKRQKVDNQVREQAIQLLGLKKFLLDYSMIEERQAIEVKLWEEYLIFAQILGIAKKVEEQFSKIYPEFNEISKITSNSSIIFTTNMISRGISAAESARERANSSSYSSGGGGSSFSSGGSGSSGSSSGGGFR